MEGVYAIVVVVSYERKKKKPFTISLKRFIIVKCTVTNYRHILGTAFQRKT